MNLKHHMELAGRHLGECLCPHCDYLPYWVMALSPDGCGSATFKDVTHNIGRWMDAMLRLEGATGFTIPAEHESASLRNLDWLTDNPDHLVLMPPDFPHRYSDGRRFKLKLDLHSLREAMMSLGSLAWRRGSHWAVERALAMIQTLERALRAEGTWDFDQFEYVKMLDNPPRRRHSTNTNGRLIEALLWFYQATGEGAAFKLAARIAVFHYEHTVRDDGQMNPDDPPHHTHSYLGTLRGLLLFGELTNQRHYLDRVAQTYHGAILERVITPSGWTSHDIGSQQRPEVASAADIMLLCLGLSRHGHTRLLDDAERILRCRLIPSQITETMPIRPAPDREGDEVRDIGDRIIGALGGVHSHTHGGKKGTVDVTASVLQALTVMYRNIAVRRSGDLFVQFHLDYEDADVRITSRRDAQATLTIDPRIDANLFVRVPGWTNENSVTFTSGDQSLRPVMVDNLAFIDRTKLGGPCVMTYDLPHRNSEETIDGVTYTLRWRGDEIEGISPNADFLPFYPSL